jgi:hypothetical protein
MLSINNLNYASWTTVVYQRTSVLVTELVFALALLKYNLLWPIDDLLNTTIGCQELGQTRLVNVCFAPLCSFTQD